MSFGEAMNYVPPTPDQVKNPSSTPSFMSLKWSGDDSSSGLNVVSYDQYYGDKTSVLGNTLENGKIAHDVKETGNNAQAVENAEGTAHTQKQPSGMEAFLGNSPLNRVHKAEQQARANETAKAPQEMMADWPPSPENPSQKIA